VGSTGSGVRAGTHTWFITTRGTFVPVVPRAQLPAEDPVDEREDEVVAGLALLEPDPFEPDPFEPDPFEPDPFEPDPFEDEDEPASADFFSDDPFEPEPLEASLPLDSPEPLEAPSFGRESVR
jgi:hypothetical protein